MNRLSRTHKKRSVLAPLRATLLMRSIEILLLLLVVFIAAFFIQYMYRTYTMIESDRERVLKILFPTSQRDQVGVAGYRKALLALEDAGGKGGTYTVELVPIDIGFLDDPDKLDDNDRLGNLLRNVTDENVVALIGPRTTGAAMQVVPILNTIGVPQVSFTASYPGFIVPDYGGDREYNTLYPTGRHTFFSIAPHQGHHVAAAIQYLQESGSTDVFVVHDSTAYGTTMSSEFTKDFSRVGNVVGSGDLTEATDDLVTNVLESKVQVVYVASYAHNKFYEFVNALTGRGYKGYIVGSFLKDLADADRFDRKSHIISINPYKTLTPQDGGEVEKLLRHYIQRFPEAVGEKSELFGSYAAMQIILQAIENSDGTQSGVLKALHQMKDIKTIYGPVTFNETGGLAEYELEVSELKEDSYVVLDRVHLSNDMK